MQLQRRPGSLETHTRVFTNGNFETPANAPPGTVPAAPWAVHPFVNHDITVQTPQTLASLDLAAGGTSKTFILHAAGGPGSQVDPNLGAGASLRWPRYGNQCAIVNQVGNNQNINELSQTMTVAAGDVDPADGKVHVRFTIAPVLQNPAHTAAEQPYYFVEVSDLTQNTILDSDFNLSGAGIPWQTVNGGTPNEIDYTNWQLVDVSPGGSAIAMGDQVELLIIAAGCEPGAHWGQIYVDGVGSTIPGISLTATGPAQANAGTNITYAMTYTNGSATAETGVVIDFTTPPDTTFESITPPPGATCTTPAVGTAGTIVCTFTGPVAAGASGTLSVTVNITAGRPARSSAAPTTSPPPRRPLSSAPRSPRSSAASSTRSVRPVTGATRARPTVCRRSPTAPPRRPIRAHEPDPERHLHRGRRSARLHERRLRHEGQRLRLCER